MEKRPAHMGPRHPWRHTPLFLVVALVLAACGGGGHPPSTATAPAFPNTPAGAQARWLVQGLNQLPFTDAAIRAHISPTFLDTTTAAEVNASLAGYGRVRLVALQSSQPRTIVFVVSIRNGQRFRVKLTVDSRGLIAALTTRALPPTASPASVIPPLAAGWVAQPVTFQVGGVTIYGTYTHPRTAAARTTAAAVLLGGAGTATDRNDNNLEQPNRNLLVAVANWLSADGVASLRYDKLGSGQTGWGRYAGHLERVGVQLYEQEAVAALDLLSRQPQVNPSRLAVVGHSQGAVYGLLLATGLAAHAPKIHAVVLLEPVPTRMLSLFVPAPGTVSPRLRQSMQRAVASLRRTGALPSGLAAEVANSFNPANWGTALELSQIDRYDPASLAAKLPAQTPVLLTCSNADMYFTCAMQDRIAAGLAKANAKIDYVHLDGVDHFLKEDLTREAGSFNQALPFSTQLRNALRAFTAQYL